MRLTHLKIRNYRSLRDFVMPVPNPCVIVGGNGVGKSNLYRVLTLVQKAAEGGFARAVVEEGGMPSLLWAGPRDKRDTDAMRMSIEARFEDWSYHFAAGMPTVNEGAFPLDPRVKEERLTWGKRSQKRQTEFLKRTRLSASLRDPDGKKDHLPFELLGTESALSQVADPARYPELSRLREAIRNWRFYHHFDSSPQSPARHSGAGTLTTILDDQGHNLAAAFASIEEYGDMPSLQQALGDALTGRQLLVRENKGWFDFAIEQEGLHRPLTGPELSDGTLRFLCLLAVLKGLRLPQFLVLNEPETSLHSDLLPTLGRLIAEASEETQVWVVTHSLALAEHITNAHGIHPIELFTEEGETKIVGQAWDQSLPWFDEG